MPNINPNSDRDFLDSVDINNAQNFPLFLKKIKFEPFRHISSLEIEFIHPISIISGTNRIGKTTILMAIACSHVNFEKKNPRNGKLGRQTWSNLMKFTSQDIQTVDWTYWITYKRGDRIEPPKRGQRKHLSKKWNGIGKRESQFTRDVIFIEIDRALPLRNFNNIIFTKSKNSTISNLSNITKVEELISYVFEETFHLHIIKEYLDKVVLKFQNTNSYSSFNSASGEDVVARLVIDMVEAPRNSLIVIDELEVGLHPKIQRRLVDVINHIARNDNKQFIITTHSPTLLSAFSEASRIFIERKNDGSLKSINRISVNAAFSKMDSKSYPLIDLYCEDDIAKKIILKAIDDLQVNDGLMNLSDLINIIESGSADKTHTNFKVHQRTYDFKKVKTGVCCILDGDMRNKRKYNGLLYPAEDELLFIFSNEAPEKFLVRSYLQNNSNINLEYHVDNSDTHCLFQKMVELSLCLDRYNAFELCWNNFIALSSGQTSMTELKNFLKRMCIKYSPNL
ncbi:MAG: AAA family ATPase [Bacteroidetes bacterium]|nr:AAA family ATPase [Bacteroidota bacterium]